MRPNRVGDSGHDALDSALDAAFDVLCIVMVFYSRQGKMLLPRQ